MSAARLRPSALGGLAVDRKFVLGRRLHRQVGRLVALEDAVDVARRALALVEEIRPIGKQADYSIYCSDRYRFAALGQRTKGAKSFHAPNESLPKSTYRRAAGARR